VHETGHTCFHAPETPNSCLFIAANRGGEIHSSEKEVFMRIHSRAFQLTSLLIATLALTSTSRADALYNDGAPNGTYAAWNISQSPQVEDSFTLSSASTLTGVTFGNWVSVGDTASTVDWAIVGSEGSQTPVCATCSGTASLSPDGTFTLTNDPGFYGVNQLFSLPDLSLSAGTYWLELQNEVVSNGDLGFWDLNGGPSMIWESLLGDQSGANCAFGNNGPGSCSDSFTIIGTAAVSSAPEPGSLALLGSGLTLLAPVLLRRRHLR
jgi:hypothetical protein